MKDKVQKLFGCSGGKQEEYVLLTEGRRGDIIFLVSGKEGVNFGKYGVV